MEQTILSQYRRLPGFHSEFVGLEVMGMSNERIGFEDVLNGTSSPNKLLSKTGVICCSRADPRDRMDAPIELHEGMEQLLGMGPMEPYQSPVSRPGL